MKTAISLPTTLFEQADRYARRTGRSRSQLVQEALAEYLLRHDPDAVTRAMDAVLDEVGEDRDTWRQAVSRQTLERVEW
jgi:predicted DNA-binding protein